MSTASPPSVPLAAQVKTTRTRLRLTQSELADTFGVAVRTVQGWEAGTTPQFRHLRPLEEWLREHDGGDVAA